MAQRYVRTTIARDGLGRTPTGGVRIPATPGRTGVLTYTNPDGTTRREYRPPEEAFAEASLASLEGAALTIDHPPDGVTAENWASLSKGFTSKGTRSADGVWIAAEAFVNEGDAVARVLARELTELSSGYTCDVDFTPGVSPDGESYDAVQRNIRYNHTALLPSGWARAGRGARLHVDSACATLCQVEPTDGVYDMNELEKAIARAVTAETALAGEKSRADSAVAKAEELSGKLAATEQALSSARADASPEAITAKVKARVALEADAVAVKGADFKADGLSDVEVLRAIVGDIAPKDASEAHLRGAAGVIVAQARKADANVDRVAAVVADLPDETDERNDAAELSPREVYEAEMKTLAAGTGLRKKD